MGFCYKKREDKDIHHMLKYLDCLHKVYVWAQLRILPSMFNTWAMCCVCTSVVIEWAVAQCLQSWCLQTCEDMCIHS